MRRLRPFATALLVLVLLAGPTLPVLAADATEVNWSDRIETLLAHWLDLGPWAATTSRSTAEPGSEPSLPPSPDDTGDQTAPLPDSSSDTESGALIDPDG